MSRTKADLVFVTGIADPGRNAHAKKRISEEASTKLQHDAEVHFFEFLPAGGLEDTTVNMIDRRAEELFQYLMRCRGLGQESASPKQSPLILLGLDVGGILLKKALLWAYDRQLFHARSKLINSDTAIYFLNTPHRAVSRRAWDRVLSSLVFCAKYWSVRIARVLESLSLVAQDISNDFICMVPREGVVSCYEGQLTLPNGGDFIDTQYTFTMELEDEETVVLPTLGRGPWSLEYFHEAADDVWSLMAAWMGNTRPKAEPLNSSCDEMINWLNQVTTANMLPGMPLPDGEIFDWITSHCIFREWLSAKKSASLLVYGSPGSGSTEFTAYALDCFRMHLQRSSVLMLSFGFDGRSEQRQSGPTLVHSLLSQILSAKPAVLRHTQQLIQSVFEHSPPSEEQLWNLLQTLITHPEDDHIFCIIALDHCDPLQDDCLNRLAAISKACQARPNPVWFLFTISSTRPPAVLDHVSSIFLDKEQSMRTNLRKYLEEQVASLMRKHPIFKQFNIQTTDDSLAFGDHFSDVMLKLDSMDQFKVGQNTEEAKQHIERLSYKNDKFLQTVFDALSPHGLLILNWMSAANRPLSVSELVVALALDVRGKNTGSLEKYKTWSITEDIRYSLGSLVHFIEHDVHFCHATIRSQFEISKHFDPLFQDRVAQICVGYIFEVKERLKGLSNKQLEDLRASTPQQESPSDLAFAKYAIWSWPMHYQLSSKPSNLRQQVERLLDDEEIRSILSGVNRMYHIKPPENESNLCLSVILASKLGLEDIVVQLILQQMSTAGFQASLRQSLTEAAGEGHRALVRILLQQDVRPEEGILPACERGHVRVLRDILDANREDTKALSDIFEHSLLVAAKYGHSEVVRELLLRGTSPNTVDSSQAAALHYAARFGHEDIVQQLVNSKEIVLGAYDEAFYNPLQLAAEAGNAKIVEILSRPGRIGPSTCMGSISPPLHLASRHGHVEVVKALVAAGAKIHSIVNGETPLHLAARHGCLEVVKWLINHVGDDPNPDVDVPSAEPSKGPGSSPDPRESSVEKKQALENSDTPLTDGRAPPNSIDNVVLDFIAKKDLSGMTALHLAAMNGHVKVAKAITEAHQVSEVVNAVDDKKDTPLHLAAGHGYELIFGYLLSIGACVDAQNDTLCTPIHVASESRRLLVVKKLLQHRLSKQVGDWIHTSNVRGLTALSLAAEQGHRSIVKEILDYFHKSEGHDAWKPDDLKALHLAARGNHSEILTLLLQYNWDPNAVNNNGDTPLHSAVSNEEGIENVKRLLEAGSDPNRKNGSLLTPLYMAVEANYVNIAEAILTVGGKRVDPNLKCGRLGWTALHKASQQEKLTKLLLDHNADHCIKNNYGSTPLILASEVGNLDSVRFLLKAGADPRVKSSTGSTALHRAAQNDYLEVTKLLLERGALINEQRNDGTTPLYWATGRWSESPVLRFLLEKGANPNIYGGYYHSCLQAASWIGNSRSIECLLEWKADPNAVGGKFGSPLMAAVLDPSPHNVSLLLEKGANPNKLDSTGKSAMHSVCSMGGNVASTYIPMFLEYKGLLSTKDEGGSTPLIHAARWAGREVIQCLRTHSACLLDVDGCQRSALYWAATRDDPHALDTLLEWLGDEDELTRVNMRSTALHAAIINNKIDNFNKLLEKDVGFNGLDRNGWTPLALAIEYEREAMIKLLRAREAVEGLESQLPPTAWNKYDKSNLLGVDGTTVFVAGSEKSLREHARAVVRADRCIPLSQDPFYFEVTITKTGSEEITGVGFCLDDAPLDRMIGWESSSWGYHGDDGFAFHGDRSGKPYGPTYTSKETIGCGVNRKTRTAFFTKNDSVIGCAFKDADIRGQLYPAVSLHPGENGARMTVKFGPGGFKYTGSWTDEACMEPPKSNLMRDDDEEFGFEEDDEYNS